MQVDSELASLLAIATQLQQLVAPASQHQTDVSCDQSTSLSTRAQQLSAAIRANVRSIQRKLAAAGVADGRLPSPGEDFANTWQRMRSTCVAIAQEGLAPLEALGGQQGSAGGRRSLVLQVLLERFGALLTKHDALLPAVQECMVAHPNPLLAVDLHIEDQGMLVAARPTHPVHVDDEETPSPLPLGRSCFARRHGHRVVTWRGRVEKAVPRGRCLGLGVVDSGRVGEFRTDTGIFALLPGVFFWNISLNADVWGAGVADQEQYWQEHIHTTLGTDGGEFTLQLNLMQGELALQCPGSAERLTMQLPKEGEYRLFVGLDLVQECSVRLFSCHVLTDFD